MPSSAVSAAYVPVFSAICPKWNTLMFEYEAVARVCPSSQSLPSNSNEPASIPPTSHENSPLVTLQPRNVLSVTVPVVSGTPFWIVRLLPAVSASVCVWRYAGPAPC